MLSNEIFEDNQIKQTQQRREVFQVLFDSSKPLSLDQIQAGCNHVDFSSVYRAVKIFVEKGIVTEHYFGERKPKYSLTLDKSHHHFIKCVQCGDMEELKNICVLNKVNKKTDYEILDHYLEFTGLCPNCKK